MRLIRSAALALCGLLALAVGGALNRGQADEGIPAPMTLVDITWSGIGTNAKGHYYVSADVNYQTGKNNMTVYCEVYDPQDHVWLGMPIIFTNTLGLAVPTPSTGKVSFYLDVDPDSSLGQVLSHGAQLDVHAYIDDANGTVAAFDDDYPAYLPPAPSQLAGLRDD